MVSKMSRNVISEKHEYRILDEFIIEPTIRIGIVVLDLKDTLFFYTERLGCSIVRELDEVVELDFFGYLVTLYLRDDCESDAFGHADSIQPYFGLTVGWEDWHKAVDHLSYVGTNFKIESKKGPRVEDGEQAVLILEDPSGNILKFVAFRRPDQSRDVEESM